ncbi:glycosyl transferase [Actinoplanes cyaneus]|uniref:Glycosyl transferase n=1 Tax=Actinoplanes cyaneus TaxID=52696 RepID=A0A919IMY2_9ACTN|nr:glycosyltransferase [Actinoplanes cyaneus]MCW2138397.1 Glycosyltransferase involved in cell wall bisynthesis [Actinoplanes cyaneus]GID66358.1 glycosyl transferase [Actinoplanes cyaneus]
MTVAPGDRHVTVVTPWYPTQMFPFRGAFVRTMVEATAPGCDSITVIHGDRWSSRVSDAEDAAIVEAHLKLLPRSKRTSPTFGGATLNYLPVPMPVGGDFAYVAKRHAATLNAAFAGKPIDAAVVHVHEALPSGWAVLDNLRPETKLFVTEHASFLETLLDEPEAREMYDKVLERCEHLFVVGDGTRDVLLKALPRHAAKVSLVANPINFGLPRAEPVTELRRWFYAGSLIPRKGVTWLLEAFAKCHAEHPELTLTIVGDGELGDQLHARVEELGLQTAVTFLGSVDPEIALQLMREHDLLVHASRWESFGVTIVEAVAAGMPVLVTRCGGPEETLAGIEEAAGELVAVEEDDTALVEGYRRLRARFPHGLDLAKAQRVLDERYGYPAVAKMHHEAWFE